MQTLDNRAASTPDNAASLPREALCSLGIASRSLSNPCALFHGAFPKNRVVLNHLVIGNFVIL